MSMSMYAASVPVFQHYLKNLSAILAKADAQAAARGMDQRDLLASRLFPDMLPLEQQVRTAADFAVRTCAPLAGLDIPAYERNEQTFAELRGRIAKALAFVGGLDPAQIDGSETRDITTVAGQAVRQFRGDFFLSHYALPNFFFHLTTAYAILRHKGIEIGKQDFDGQHAYGQAGG